MRGHLIELSVRSGRLARDTLRAVKAPKTMTRHRSRALDTSPSAFLSPSLSRVQNRGKDNCHLRPRTGHAWGTLCTSACLHHHHHHLSSTSSSFGLPAYLLLLLALCLPTTCLPCLLTCRPGPAHMCMCTSVFSVRSEPAENARLLLYHYHCPGFCGKRVSANPRRCTASRPHVCWQEREREREERTICDRCRGFWRLRREGRFVRVLRHLNRS